SNTGIIGRKMTQNVKYVFGIRVDGAGYFFRCLSGRGAKIFTHLCLQLQQFCRRLFSCLYSRLMISVDVDERSIETDRTLVQRNQRSNVEFVHFRDAHGDQFTSALIKSAACPAQESLKIIAAGDAVFHVKGHTMSIFANLDESDEKIQNTVAQLLE